MSVATRSAMVQARVYPDLKHAGEDVLRRIGLTMTEAMELFLRRMILDQKLPFEVIALDDATLMAVEKAWRAESRVAGSAAKSARATHRERQKNRNSQKKNSKTFL